ncbi:MAG: hypothetical protein ACRDSH_17585, partial [Pseudonocardiaceae bacterium]
VSPAPALPKGFADYDLFFKLEAQHGGKPLGELNRAATIEVKYSALQVDAKVLPTSLRLYSYDENQKAWSTDGISVIARTDNLLTCSTTRLGKFAVTGKWA